MKWTVLLVDDSRTIHEVVRMTFNNTEFNLLLAANGEAGLTIAQKAKPDLILADVKMPEMDGYELCRMIKENPETKSVPVLLFIGKNMAPDMARSKEVHAQGFFFKPFDTQELLDQATMICEAASKAAPVPGVEAEPQVAKERQAEMPSLGDERRPEPSAEDDLATEWFDQATHDGQPVSPSADAARAEPQQAVSEEGPPREGEIDHGWSDLVKDDLIHTDDVVRRAAVDKTAEPQAAEGPLSFDACEFDLGGDEIALEEDDVLLEQDDISLEEGELTLEDDELALEEDELALEEEEEEEELAIGDEDLALEDEEEEEEEELAVGEDDLALEEEEISLDEGEMAIEEEPLVGDQEIAASFEEILQEQKAEVSEEEMLEFEEASDEIEETFFEKAVAPEPTETEEEVDLGFKRELQAEDEKGRMESLRRMPLASFDERETEAIRKAKEMAKEAAAEEEGLDPFGLGFEEAGETVEEESAPEEEGAEFDFDLGVLERDAEPDQETAPEMEAALEIDVAEKFDGELREIAPKLDEGESPRIFGSTEDIGLEEGDERLGAVLPEQRDAELDAIAQEYGEDEAEPLEEPERISEKVEAIEPIGEPEEPFVVEPEEGEKAGSETTEVADLSPDMILDLFRQVLREELEGLAAPKASTVSPESEESIRRIVREEIGSALKELDFSGGSAGAESHDPAAEGRIDVEFPEEEDIAKAVALKLAAPLADLHDAIKNMADAMEEIKSSGQKNLGEDIYTWINSALSEFPSADEIRQMVRENAKLPQTEEGAAAGVTAGADVAEAVRAAIREELGSAASSVTESIAWEVVPDLAEAIIKKELERLMSERV